MVVEHMSDSREMLAARLYLYSFFSRVYSGEPTESFDDALDADSLEEALRLAIGADCEGEIEAFRKALSLKPRWSELRGDYMRLFVGPGPMLVPPWESVHVLRENALFTQVTQEVRSCYRRQGYLSAQYPKVADDHIALELDFLSKMSGSMLEERDDGAEASYATYLEASKSFLEGHLLKWISSFEEMLNEAAGTSFYSAMAKSLATFLAADYRNLCTGVAAAG